MEDKINILHFNKWLSLCEVVNPDKGINGYAYSHETRCNGKILAILPFENNGPRRMYLLREELTPAWSTRVKIRSSITGGIESVDVRKNAIRELKEEAGYRAKRDEFIYLGECYGSKSCDTVYQLFAIDVTGKKQKEAKGDGSRLEREAKTIWVPAHQIISCDDPLVSVMYVRLKELYQ